MENVIHTSPLHEIIHEHIKLYACLQILLSMFMQFYPQTEKMPPYEVPPYTVHGYSNVLLKMQHILQIEQQHAFPGPTLHYDYKWVIKI